MMKVEPKFKVGDFVYLLDTAPRQTLRQIGPRMRGEIVKVWRASVSARFGIAGKVYVLKSSWIRKG